MKKIFNIVILLLLIMGFNDICYGAFESDRIRATEGFYSGDGTDKDIYYYASNGDANNPALRYLSSGSNWQYSNDGTTWEDLVSDHGSLTGLGDQEDHLWALYRDGTNDLTGDWTIATNSITLTAGTLTAEQVTSTGDITVSNLIIQNGLVVKRDDGVSLGDDGILSLTPNTTGRGFIQVENNEEWAYFEWEDDGTPHISSSSLNVVNSDTDANLCFYSSSSSLRIKNRLGSSKSFLYTLELNEPAPTFLPTDLASTIFWLNNEDSSTITLNGSNVSQVDDGSVNGNNATQSIGTAQALYSLGAMNGLNVCYFDGGDYFDTDSVINLTGEFSIIVVLKTADSSQVDFYLGHSSDDIKFGHLGGNFFARVIDGGAVDTSQSFPTGDAYIALFRDSSNKIDISINGGALTRLFSDVAQVGTLSINYISRTSSAGQNWTGETAEIIKNEEKISDVEYALIKTYFSKWGL